MFAFYHHYIISSGFSTMCGAHIFPNHFCGSIHHSVQCLSASFFHSLTRTIANLSVCKVLCGCAIILTRVILFSSSYVNVDVLSAFHVSTSMPVVVFVVLCAFFFLLIFNLMLQTRLSFSASPFVIMRRFHLRKLIRQTEQKGSQTQTHEMEWNGNWYANFQVSAEKVIIFTPIYLFDSSIFNFSLSLSVCYPPSHSSTSNVLLSRVSVFNNELEFCIHSSHRQMRLLRWLLKTMSRNYKNISVVGWLYFTNH